MNLTGFILVFSLFILAPSAILAATGRILDETEVKQADATALAAEAALFKSIGQGIALSLSQCEEQSDCNPGVSKEELGHLLDTLDKRINDLVSRQEQKQADYTEVLTAYVNQREAFLGYQAELDKITGATTGAADLETDTLGETGDIAEPETSTTEAATADTGETTPVEEEKAGEAEIDMDVFSDVEEKLE